MINALVVEDERDIRQLMVAELVDRGYQVREAHDGEIALLRVKEQKPDIIFVDIMMPVMGGIDFISILRKNPETFRIPVVIVTVLKLDETRGKPRKLGVEYHLTKPWEPWALDAVLTKVLGPAAPVAPAVK